MLHRKNWLCLILVLVILVATACGGQQKKPMIQKQQSVQIGVSVTDAKRNGNQTIKMIFEEQGKKDQAQITWLDAKGDPVQQQRDVQKLIEKKVKVVVLQVTDPTEGAALVNRLAENNIKVIALEALPHNTPVDGYITSDHSRTGQLQLRYLETLLQQAQEFVKQGQVMLVPQQSEGGQQQIIIPAEQQAAIAIQDGKPLKLVVLQGDPQDQMAVAITGAINSGLQGLENIEVVLNQPHPRWDVNLAKATMQQLLAEGKEVDAVLANDSHLAMAAVEVLKQYGQERRVITIGTGADAKAMQALLKGEHDAEVDNRPDMLASLAYQAAKDMAENKPFAYNSSVVNGDYTVPTKVVPPRLIQQQNAYLLQERMKKEGKQAGSSQGGQGGGQQGQSSQSGSQGQQGSQSQGQQQQGGQQGQSGGAAGQKTTLKITTKEGKEVEVQIDGEVKSIQSTSDGQQGQQQGQQQGGQGGQSGGSQGGGGSQ